MNAFTQKPDLSKFLKEAKASQVNRKNSQNMLTNPDIKRRIKPAINPEQNK